MLYFILIQFVNAFAKLAMRCNSRSILSIFRTTFSGNGLQGSEIQFPKTDFLILNEIRILCSFNLQVL